MYKFVTILALCAVQSQSQTPAPINWVNRARLSGGESYFGAVMQDLVYELEKQEWCNLKLTDIQENMNKLVANFRLNGTLTYTNGFVISIQKIDYSRVTASVGNVNATVQGLLNFHHVKLGYDIITDFEELGQERFTGEVTIPLIAWNIAIKMDVFTKEKYLERLDVTLGAVGLGRTRMSYYPVTSTTELISRYFQISLCSDGVRSWRPKFITILTDIINNKVEYPRVCFTHC